jgi:hypothetical protein
MGCTALAGIAARAQQNNLSDMRCGARRKSVLHHNASLVPEQRWGRKSNTWMT